MSPRITLPMLLLLPLLVAPACAPAENRPGAPPGTHVIDVRSEAEWRQGHLEGAVLIPHDRIGSDIAGLTADKGARLFLYCRSGRRSAMAAEALRKKGYRDPVDLKTPETASRVLGRRIAR